MFPTLSEYNKTIQVQGAHAFRTLKNLFFIPARTSPIKIYSFGSGSFAVVFKALENGKEIAIRCFIGTDNDYVERYRKIDKYLNNINEKWKTNIEFLENEIEVNGNSYPIIKMDWVEGKLLDRFLNNNLHNNNLLSELQNQILKTSINLEINKIAHGDIQCGNIIIKENNNLLELKLIDYDGMYIPDFEGKEQIERGRSEFQHPKRDSFVFNEEIDRFSFWVILCALEALKFDKSLWKEIMQGGFNTTDNLLFVASDFSNPNQSRLFNTLEKINQPSLNFYLKKLKDAINYSKIDKIELFDESVNIIEEIPKETIVINNNKVFSEYIGIKIITTPSGASVRNKNLESIGSTPLTINKLEFLNQEIRIIYSTKSKSIDINEKTRDIYVDFDNITINKPIIENKEENISNEIKQQKSSDYSTLIWFSLILIVIIAGVISYEMRKNDYDYNSDEIPAVDTTSYLEDSTAVNYDSYDSYAVADSSATETNEYYVDSSAAPAVDTYENSNDNEFIQKISHLNGGYLIDKIVEYKYDQYKSEWVIENTIKYGELYLNYTSLSFKKPPSDVWKHVEMVYKEFDYKDNCFVLKDNYNQLVLIDEKLKQVVFYSNPNYKDEYQNAYVYYILRKSEFVKIR